MFRLDTLKSIKTRAISNRSVTAPILLNLCHCVAKRDGYLFCHSLHEVFCFWWCMLVDNRVCKNVHNNIFIAAISPQINPKLGCAVVLQGEMTIKINFTLASHNKIELHHTSSNSLAACSCETALKINRILQDCSFKTTGGNVKNFRLLPNADV